MSDFKKYDQDKLRYDLITPRFMRLLAEGLTYGAKKYDNSETDLNYKKNTDIWRYYGAVMRHFEAQREGEIFDQESGLPHLALAAVNIMFLIEIMDIDVTKPDPLVREAVQAITRTMKFEG